MENNIIREYIISSAKKINDEKPGSITEEQIEQAIKYYSNSKEDLATIFESIDQQVISIREEEKERHYDLNDFFDCRVSHGSLHLHVVPTSIREDIRKMGSGFYDYVSDKLTDALDKLPDILEDPNNSDIKTIMAVSPLLRSDRAKAVFIACGFDVVEDVPEVFKEMFHTDRIGLVTISKEKFLDRQEKTKSI